MVLQPHELYIAVAVTLLLVGPCLGSFASAIAYRVPRGKSWIIDERTLAGGKGGSARSACPSCGYTLTFFDLIPILSWLVLRGKCRNCHAPVSAFYPTLEITALIFSQLFLFTLGPDWILIPVLAALPFVMAQGVIIWNAPYKQELTAISIQLLCILTGLAAVMVMLRLEISLSLISGAGGLALFGAAVIGLRKLTGKELAPFRSPETVKILWLLAMIGGWIGIGLVPLFLITAGVLGVGLAALRIRLKFPRHDGLIAAYLAAFVVILGAGPQIMALLIF